MNRPANPAILTVATLSEKSRPRAEPRNVLSFAGPGPNPFVPIRPKGPYTIRCRPRGTALKAAARDQTKGNEWPRKFAAVERSQMSLLLFP